MAHRSLVATFLLAAVLLVCLPEAALAHGGRYAGPAAPRSPADHETPQALHPSGCPEEDPPTPPPAPPVTPGVPTPTPGGGIDIGSRVRRAGRAGIGPTDWVHWYEVNREEFEDLQRARGVTDANPIFGAGAADGPALGAAVPHLGSRTRSAIRAAIENAIGHDDEHWVHTEAAAYVALGKVATRTEQVERLMAPLEDDATTAYLREFAALGLGHLARSAEAQQLPPGVLDRVRAALRRALSNDGDTPRTRAFAAVSLGLLSGQPTAEGGDGAAHTVSDLLHAWMRTDPPEEVQVGILLALSMQEPAAVSSLGRHVLQAAALRRRIAARECSSLVRGLAALTLAHVGTPEDAAVLGQLLRMRRSITPITRQAIALAAGVLGERFHEARGALTEDLLEARSNWKEPGSRRLALMALGRILAAEAGAGDTASLVGARAGSHLLKAAEEGPPEERAFAALALALVLRPVDAELDSAAHQAFRQQALVPLRAGLEDRALDGHARGAFCTALGLVHDRRSLDGLLALLKQDDGDPELRAYAALGLGLIGEAREDVLTAIRAALRDPRSDVLRMRATTALGLLGGGSSKDRDRTLEMLVDELRQARSQPVKGQVAITLARIGDGRVVSLLVGMLEGERESHQNRAVACAALGLLGDPEPSPLLSATRRDLHYLCGASVVFEILDLL